MQIFVKPDGSSRCLYGEFVNLAALGKLAIARGSYVEPTVDGQWTADMAPANGPILGPFASRSEALDAERAWLEEYWLPNAP